MAAQKKRLAHVCILVKDLDQAIKDYTAILSIVDPKQLEKQIVRYEDFGYGNERMKWATFPAPGDACEIQLAQPLTPGTPMYERLQKKGEGVHHICFTATDIDEVCNDLKKKGIALTGDPVTDEATIPNQRWTFISPKAGHGLLIELARTYDAVKGKWVVAKKA